MRIEWDISEIWDKNEKSKSEIISLKIEVFDIFALKIKNIRRVFPKNRAKVEKTPGCYANFPDVWGFFFPDNVPP